MIPVVNAPDSRFKKLSILRLAQRWLPLIGAFVWLLFIQFIFHFLMHSQGLKLFQFIQGQVRQEFQFANYAFLNRNLTDLESLGVIKCTRLVLQGAQPAEVLNLGYRSECQPRSEYTRLMSAIDLEFTGEVLSINGDRYQLDFIANPGAVAVTSLWALRIIGILTILAISNYLDYRRRAESRILAARESVSNAILLLSKQVAHDIRSPLSALSIATQSIPNLSVDRRDLITGAVDRINKIASDLLSNSKQYSEIGTNSQTKPEQIKLDLKNTHIPSIVESIVAEKKMQFRDAIGICILTDFRDGISAFATIDSAELMRVLSNLINNSVEALNSNQGTIEVFVSKRERFVEILIKDSGRGISEDILVKLGSAGFSHGKNGTSSGSGLGIFHAKRVIEAMGGQFVITSVVNVGTQAKVLLPEASVPKWFAEKIVFKKSGTFVTLFDEAVTLDLCSARFQESNISNAQHLNFQTAVQFSKFVLGHINQLRDVQFLLDNDLSRESKTGLDLIEELGIEKQASLITNRLEILTIQDRAETLNLKIIPKFLFSAIPLVINEESD